MLAPCAPRPEDPRAAETTPTGDHHDHHEEDEWRYELVAAYPLPTIDLSVSVLSMLAGHAVDAAFFRIMRRHYGKFVVLFRAGTVVMFVTFVTPSSVGHVTTALTACLALGSLHFSVLMMSWQLLLRIFTMQEVLFMSLMNLLNWVTLATLFKDFRSLVCLLQAWSFQLSILSDVMFRTVLSASKTSVLALPMLLLCVLVVFLRLIDVHDDNYAAIQINNIHVELVDVFLNVSLTLCLLVARNIYRQRRAFAKTDAKLICCTLLKSKLVLQPAPRAAAQLLKKSRPSSQTKPSQATGPHASILHSPNSKRQQPADTATVVPLELVHLERLRSPRSENTTNSQPNILQSSHQGRQKGNQHQAPVATAIDQKTPQGRPVDSRRLRRAQAAAAGFIRRMSVISYTKRAVLLTRAYDRSQPHLQQLRLVPTGLKTIDSRRTLIPSLTPTHHHWSILARIVHQTVGLSGLVLMVISSISLDKPPTLDTPRLISRDIQHLLGLLSFSLSLVFVATSVVTMQTTLLRLLLRHFDVMMNLFQFFTGALCLCAMVRWDRRCLVAATLCVWFFWIVSFDAVTPRVRSHMGLTKRHAGIALVAVMACLVRVVVVLTFDAHNGYVDSEIMESWIRSDVRIQVRTKSFFLNRMFPLTVWAVRLLWELLCCREAELVFLKGSLEYYCALDMLPTAKPASTALVALSIGR